MTCGLVSDVKSALEMESLGHLHPIFKEQEVRM